MENLNMPIIGEGWLNFYNIRPTEDGWFLVAKYDGENWYVSLAYYDTLCKHFLEAPEKYWKPILDLQFWHFLPDLPEEVEK